MLGTAEQNRPIPKTAHTLRGATTEAVTQGEARHDTHLSVRVEPAVDDRPSHHQDAERGHLGEPLRTGGVGRESAKEQTNSVGGGGGHWVRIDVDHCRRRLNNHTAYSLPGSLLRDLIDTNQTRRDT